LKPGYFHGHPGAALEVQLAGLSPTDFAPADTTTTHAIGFSLGGPAALTFVATHPNVTQLDLIACPAPLGRIIPDMAGKPVFRSARVGLLPAMTTLQALFLKIAPNLFLKTLFASATASEKAVLTPKAKAILAQSYKTALLRNKHHYLNQVISFANPKADWSFDKITCAVTLWQGDDDTWVPPSMVDTLASHLPQAKIKRLPGLGHYGTLIHALPQIMRS